MNLARFETKRLIIRPFTLNDVDAAYEVNRDPEISKYTGDGGPKSREEIERILRDRVLADYQKYGYGRYAVIHKETQENIGFSGLKYLPEMNEVDLGYRFSKKYWGNGIATESCHPFLEFGFNALKLKKIIGLVLPENIASIRVLEKLGFSFQKKLFDKDQEVLQYALKQVDY